MEPTLNTKDFPLNENPGRKKKYIFTRKQITDCLYVKYMAKIFTSLRSAPVNMRAALLSDLTLDTCYEAYKDCTGEELQIKFRIKFRILNSPIFSRRIRRYQTQFKDIFTSINNGILKYIKLNLNDFKFDPKYDIYREFWSEETKNLLNKEYASLNIYHINSIDSTTYGNTRGTIIKEHCSKLISHIMVLEDEPTGTQISQLIEENFNSEFISNVIQKNNGTLILHADVSGANVDREIRETCNKYGIKLSFGTQALLNTNQVAERTNRTLWDETFKLVARDLEDIDFPDLPFKIRKKIILTATKIINARKINSYVIPKNASPNLIILANRLMIAYRKSLGIICYKTSHKDKKTNLVTEGAIFIKEWNTLTITRLMNNMLLIAIAECYGLPIVTININDLLCLPIISHETTHITNNADSGSIEIMNNVKEMREEVRKLKLEEDSRHDKINLMVSMANRAIENGTKHDLKLLKHLLCDSEVTLDKKIFKLFNNIESYDNNNKYNIIKIKEENNKQTEITKKMKDTYKSLGKGIVETKAKIIIEALISKTPELQRLNNQINALNEPTEIYFDPNPERVKKRAQHFRDWKRNKNKKNLKSI